MFVHLHILASGVSVVLKPLSRLLLGLSGRFRVFLMRQLVRLIWLKESVVRILKCRGVSLIHLNRTGLLVLTMIQRKEPVSNSNDARREK